MNNEENKTRIAIFQDKEIRKTMHDHEWWFSIIDVIAAITDSSIPRRYWSDLKNKLTNEGYSELYEKIVQLKIISTDGKYYFTDCANTQTILRIIQTIPSPKAEPFKRWLAKVGYERIQEIENPELSAQRARVLYKAKGYPFSWIEQRMRNILIRDELTDEWQERGVNEKDYGILTAEISKTTFGITPAQHKDLKGITGKAQRIEQISFPSRERNDKYDPT